MYFERNFWNRQYTEGRGSGPGSKGEMLQYKIDFLNKFIDKHSIKTMTDFGCGDGKLMSKLKIEDDKYMGIDISEKAIDLCKIFRPKSHFKCCPFPELNTIGAFVRDISICIDVLFHIIDIEELKLALTQIFDLSERYVVLYTMNTPRDRDREHVKSRCISEIIENLNIKYNNLHKYPGHPGTEAMWLIYGK